MINKDLLNILFEPKSGQSLTFCDKNMLGNLNGKIPEGLDSGLLSKDNKELYPIRKRIPIMLEEEAISIDGNTRVKYKRDGLREDIKKYFDDQWTERHQVGVKFWQDDGFSYRLCQSDALKQLGDLNGAKVLILGAGRGYEAKQFIERGAWVVTTDIALEGLSQNNDSSLKVVSDAERLFFKSESFDLVYTQNMLMFIRPTIVYEEINKVLKNRGKYISIESTSDSYMHPILKKVFAKFDKYDYLKNNHPNYLKKEDFKKMHKYFKTLLYHNQMFVFPIHSLLKILKLEKMIEKWLNLEQRIINGFPQLKSRVWMEIYIFQK